MKMSRTAIKELTAAYRAVLKHAFIAAMGAVMVIGGASADDEKVRIVIGGDETRELSGEYNGYVSGTWGGVAYVSGTLDVGQGTVFTDNKGFVGGAIAIEKQKGVLHIADNVTFEGNTAIYDGGAIGNYGGAVISKNAVFRNNHANINLDGSEITSDEQPIGGGAISMGVNGQLDIVNGLFENNTSGYDGGAIGTRRTLQPSEKTEEGFATLGNHIKITDSTFVGNQATGKTSDIKNGQKVGGNGGAIANTFATTEISGTTFTNNTAETNGGAIYNHTFINVDATGTDTGLGGVMTINDSVFSKNTVSTGSYAEGKYKRDGVGGAIASSGTLTVANSTFENNSALAPDDGYGLGGAIATVTSDTPVGSTISLNIQNSIFTNNQATYGGAVYGMLKTSGKSGISDVKISDSKFTSNTAVYTGAAIANFDMMTITNSDFIKNEVLADVDGETDGGALFIGSESKTSITGGSFQGNSSALMGGAIATRFSKGKNSQAAAGYTIDGTLFANNHAGTDGGAIWNTFYHDADATGDGVVIKNATFTGNSADKSGGAIFNDGTGDKNGTVGSIILSGNNTFTGNTANGVANDIHNLGKLTVADGTTTIDGGITGDTGTLTVADGATLNIGTATVEQAELTLDGTVGATIIGANNYGKLLAETYNGNGKVSLNVATTGTYNIFSETANEYAVVDAGAVYDVTKGDNGAVVIKTKSVDKIAADTGLTDATANVVAGLANSDNALANIASLNVQQALRDGNVGYIEAETAKVNPDDKPVAQSAAQSVQGAVMTLAANRMAGAPSASVAGRSGGDWSNADYGVWAQGMFNKSKYNGQFNGYTRGIAAGVDALIDNQYTVGLGYAFGHSDINAKGGRDTEIDSNSIFAYAQYKPSEWYINAALNYTMSQYTETGDAFGVRLESDYDVNAFGGQVMTGYDFASGLTPEGGVRYLHVSQDSYGNGLNHVDSRDTDFLTGIAGLKYRFAIDNGSAINWFPELRAAATYDFVSDKAQSTVTMPGAAPYVVDSGRLSRFGGEFGIGLTAEYNGVEISLNYDLDLHEDYTSQTSMLKFRYEF